MGHGGCSPRAFRYRWRFALAFRAEVHVDVEVVLVLECELRKVRFVILCAKPLVELAPIAELVRLGWSGGGGVGGGDR